MLRICRDGAEVTQRACIPEVQQFLRESGVEGESLARVADMIRRTLGREVWSEGEWSIERMAPSYYGNGRPGGTRECEECGKVSEKLYVCDECAER
jgi:hypothetical protein